MDFNDLLSKCVDNFKKDLKQIELANGMPVVHRKAHTATVPEGVSSLRPLREASVLYAELLLSGMGDKVWRDTILENIKSVQITDPSSNFNGNFLWYMEETAPHDGNAGFFILSPLASLLTLAPDKVPAADKEKILSLRSKATLWFVKECRLGAIYYSNAIISSGSMLYAIGKLTGNEEAIRESEAFISKFMDYTVRRGWGWGENTSLCYAEIILDALKLISLLTDSGSLSTTINGLISELFSWYRFHGEYDCVPSIRDYNFDGLLKIPRFTYLPAGVTDDPSMVPLNLLHILLYKDDIMQYDSRHASFLNSKQKTVNMHIFDESYAYAWKGRDVRFGTITHFPVMKGCYMPSGGGIGWQSMPASILDTNGSLNFLRITSSDGETIRSHPVRRQLTPTFTNVPLFTGNTQPEVNVLSSQNENLGLIIRRIDHLHNPITVLRDEWALKNFSGTSEKIVSNGIHWIIARFKTFFVLFGALPGLPVIPHQTSKAMHWCEASRTREFLPLSAIKEGNDTLIAQTIYDGEFNRADTECVETVWAVVVCENEDPLDYLKQLHITWNFSSDGEIARPASFLIYNAELSDGVKDVRLTFDPYLCC